MSTQAYQDAGQAVRAEFRRCSATVELKCRTVTPVQGEENLFCLDVGSFADFDWTWEGATAFRAQNVKGEEEMRDWSGEVVEVDQDGGALYVYRDSPAPPCTGSFLVRPFGFLEALNAAYNGQARGSLQAGLEASLPRTLGPKPEGLLEEEAGLESLSSVWRHPWSILWGPPGTGKTWTIGEQVARATVGGGGRILVVSTTNKATDGAALSVGRAMRKVAGSLEGIARVGSGANIRSFEREGLPQLLRGTQAELRRTLADLLSRYEQVSSPADRAQVFHLIKEVKKALRDATPFLDASLRVVVSTAHHAVQQLVGDEVASAVRQQQAPFDTVIADEAGLVSRSAAAALALLARRRFMLVGDPRQLAPISRMTRVLPTAKARWLGCSGLAHLSGDVGSPSNVHLLAEQRRMCPEIRLVVSEYQYGGRLRDAEGVRQRPFRRSPLLQTATPATWYVLDEESVPLAHVRAERGPGNRSWARRVTTDVIGKIRAAHPELEDAEVLFLSPFAAQVRRMKEYLASSDMGSWTAATVHSQQGAEADCVIFDTVNASSTAWPHDEWKRLINVAMSRARFQLFVLSSRDEMRQPYLSQLTRYLAPRRLRGKGGKWQWLEVDKTAGHQMSREIREKVEGLGSQLETRRSMRPVLSQEQQQLSSRELDGKPRLVRGVAGSGKTVVLAHWLVQTLSRGDFKGKAWVVYGNMALRGLLVRLLEEAWNDKFPALPLPWEDIELRHVRDVMEDLLSEVGLQARGFDYEQMASSYLLRMGKRGVEPRCQALFIDEAQDLGHETLRLLCMLVESHDTDPNSRSVMIFYDNAQNVYGRGTPRWVDFGLDMRGRSTVMKESFRSTRPITEFAVNVLYRLWSPDKDPDLKTLVDEHLVEPTERNGRRWYTVHYNQIDGPPPEFERYTDREAEIRATADRIRACIEEEGVRPSDIKVLCNQRRFRRRLTEHLQVALAGADVEVEERKSEGFPLDENVLVVSTSHSFKGYEAEIVVVPGVDLFVAKGEGVLHHPLYVALTRARSLLFASGVSRPRNPLGDRVLEALEQAWEDQRERPAVIEGASRFARRHDLVARIGAEHADWVDSLLKHFEIQEEPLTGEGNRILAEPLFWLKSGATTWACFGPASPSTAVRDRLEDNGVTILEPGERFWRDVADDARQ